MPILIGLILLLIDQASKYYTQLHLPLMSVSSPWYPYGGIGIFENFFGIQFSISFATNKGAAWGAFAEYSSWLFALRLGLIAFLIAAYFRASRPLRFALALILAGAIGNVLDIFFYGHVVDMLHFVLWGYEYPVFNVADSAIFCGILLYFVLSRKHHAGNEVA